MFEHLRDALPSIKALALQRIPISLTSSYKGLLFDEKVIPLRFGSNHVAFRAPSREVCCTLHDPVILHSRVLPETVRATTEAIDIGMGEVRLTNFEFTGTAWRDRSEQRIQPAKPILSTVKIEKNTYHANIANLSLHGAGLLVFLMEESVPVRLIGLPCDLHFLLDEQTPLSLQSRVITARMMGTSTLSLGLRLFPTATQEIWLENMIAHRKVEIMSELKHQVKSNIYV